jgi:O-antigen/teichoic acid export membrane protein
MKAKLPSLNRSVRNVLATWGLQASTLLFALISVPMVSQRFGLEGLGLWLLVQQLASHFQLLELGLASSLGRFLARDLALQDGASYTRHSASAIALLLILGTLIVGLAIPMAWAFPQVFKLPPDLAQDAVWMLAIALIATGLMLPLRSAVGILSSQHRFALLAGGDGLALLLRIVLVILACRVVQAHALIALALAVFLPNLLGATVLWMSARRDAPYPVMSKAAIGTQAVRELLSVSLAALVVTFAAVLLRQGSAMLAGYSLGVEAVPLLALPMMVVVSVSPFLGIANQLIAPIASQLDAQSQTEQLRQTYFTAARYSLSAGLLILIAMGWLMPHLLPIWLGRSILRPDQLQILQLNLMLVFTGYGLAIPAMLARSVLVSVGKHKFAARGEMISVVVGLAIGWGLMDIVGLGTTGMACGILSAYLLRAYGSLIHQLAFYLELPLVQLYLKVWTRPLLCSFPLLLIFLPAIFGHPNGDIQATLAVPLLLLWSGLTLRLVLLPDHQQRIRLFLKRCLKHAVDS